MKLDTYDLVVVVVDYDEVSGERDVLFTDVFYVVVDNPFLIVHKRHGEQHAIKNDEVISYALTLAQ